jgi:predicted RNase H-like HicB family nuclease
VEYRFQVVLVPETAPGFAGYYNASAPGLPGCFSYGASREEALENIREAILLYIEDLQARGESIPNFEMEEVLVQS